MTKDGVGYDAFPSVRMPDKTSPGVLVEDKPVVEECLLDKHPEWEGCCCICRYHLKDCSDPSTDGGKIMSQRGWVCAGFAFCEAEPTAFSGWSEHGLCELFKAVGKPECDRCGEEVDVAFVLKFCETHYREVKMDKLSITAGRIFFVPLVVLSVLALVKKCLGWRR